MFNLILNTVIWLFAEALDKTLKHFHVSEKREAGSRNMVIDIAFKARVSPIAAPLSLVNKRGTSGATSR